MAWFKVDDKLHDHRKVRKAGKAAMGVWVMAGSWSMDNETDGFIPSDVLPRWGSRTDAASLVAVGLWDVDDHNGETGWRFHDWSYFQPSAAVTAAKQAAEREAGLRGNHKRWHVDRAISDPDCPYCYRVPDQEPDRDPDGVDIGWGESAPNRPVPEPDPVPHVSPIGDTSSGRSLVVAPRAEVAELCEHLADKIAEDGSKRPPIGKTWHTACRLMLDTDGRTVDEVRAAIDWSQQHPFWRSNILSMPTLREKFDRLRKQAMAERNGGGGSKQSRSQQDTDDMFARAMARAEAKDAAMRGEGA